MAIIENEKIILDTRTIDAVTPGQQQPEVDHMMKTEKSKSGYFQDESWRKADEGGYFSYVMRTNMESGLSLLIRYKGNEKGERQFDIFIDGEKLVTENFTGKWNKSGFVNLEYRLPDSMVAGKKTVEVKFQSQPGSSVSEVSNVRVLRKIPVK